jgi:Sulphur transport
MAPGNFATGLATVIGGALLGVGALINRGCVFGAVAKLGSGKWAYAFTPIGFFLGCLAAVRLTAAPTIVSTGSPLIGTGVFLAIPLAVFAVWRGQRALRALLQGRFAAHICAPHQATMIIGLAFVLMILTVGNWAYTDLLAELARGSVTGLTVKLALFSALFAGAIVGGWTAGLIKPAIPAFRDILRYLIGGMLMGFGSLSVPGSNDGLILVGLPLFLPYAWIALATMVLAIFLGMLIERWATER